LYKQIASDLQQKIQGAELAPGEQLPREEALREEYGASRNTIRDAIKWLTSRGLVESKTGKGTYVLRGHRPFVTTLSEDRDPEVPNEEEARFFGMPDDGRIPVVSLIRTGYEDKPGEGPYPFRVTFTILPADRNQFVVNRGKVPEELAAPARDQ
jgi:DNA-binding transcriptional MocR family regulator